MKRLLSLLVICVPAYASMPSAPSSSYTSESIRTAEGLECRTDSGGIQVYGGLYGQEQQAQDLTTIPNFGHPATNDRGVHLGFSFRVGGKSLDCRELYRLSLEREKLELARLRTEIEMLRKIKTLEAVKQLAPPPPLNQ